MDNFPHPQSCPAGLYWHDVKKQCTYKNQAVCGPVEATEPPPTTENPYAAVNCDPANCQLPECFCSKDGTRIPGDLNPEQVPQMVIIALDGAVNGQNYPHYVDLFNDTAYKNPNECPMRGTFFVSHEYTNYQMVQDMHYKGHEISIYSVTSRNLADEPYSEWIQEMVGMRSMLEKWANVSSYDVLGLRAPRLKPGYNNQYDMMLDYGYAWDSSIAVPPQRIPVWPYTLDYKVPHECRSKGCPTSSYPGIWEIPLNTHYIEGYEAGHCPYLDQCVLFNYRPEEILNWFIEDFNRYYTQNRAPYVLSFHTNWFNEKALREGLHLFMDWLNKKDDVWFVTMTQALLWMTDPVPISQIGSLEDWDCRKRQNIPPPPCNLPNSCRLTFKPPKGVDSAWLAGTRYMGTCKPCPRQYPWLYDVDGKDGPRDSYEPEA